MTNAVKRVYAVAPTGVIIYETLELRHSDFLNFAGTSGPVRIVRGNTALTATLEATAPLNPGASVAFTPYAFELITPPIEDKSSPETNVIIDNIDRWIIGNIERSLESLEPIEVTYRTYLSSDLTTPMENPPLNLILSDVTANLYQVRARARFSDLSNKSFPTEFYNPLRFPSLAT
jgi:hypothetical protein